MSDSPDDLSEQWFIKDRDRGTATTPLAISTEGNIVVPLVDGASYMSLLYETIQDAGKTKGDFVVIAGLEMTFDTLLIPGDATTGIGKLLKKLRGRGCDVRVLLSGHLAFTWSLGNKAVNDTYSRLWEGPPEERVQCLRDWRQWRISGAAHQKLVVAYVGGVLHGFCGGIDLTVDRWDTRDHPSAIRKGQDFPGGWHDVHTYVKGPACRDLLITFTERWNDTRATSRSDLTRIREDPERYSAFKPGLLSDDLAMSDATRVEKGTHLVQVLRTYGCKVSRYPTAYPFAPSGEYSAKKAWLHAIGQAKRLIYIEDQYFYSYEAAEAIVAAMNNNIDLRVIVLVTFEPSTDAAPTWQNYYRFRAVNRIINELKSDRKDHFAIYHLWNHKLMAQIYVHAKLTIVDDTWVMISSMNLNRKSMTHDQELGLAVIDTAGTFAKTLRISLWREHLNVGLGDWDPPDDPIEGFNLWRTTAGLTMPEHRHRSDLEPQGRQSSDGKTLWGLLDGWALADPQAACPPSKPVPDP